MMIPLRGERGFDAVSVDGDDAVDGLPPGAIVSLGIRVRDGIAHSMRRLPHGDQVLVLAPRSHGLAAGDNRAARPFPRRRPEPCDDHHQKQRAEDPTGPPMGPRLLLIRMPSSMPVIGGGHVPQRVHHQSTGQLERHGIDVSCARRRHSPGEHHVESRTEIRSLLLPPGNVSALRPCVVRIPAGISLWPASCSPLEVALG